MPARPRPDREQGVIETLLVLDGRPVQADAHLARLGASLRALFPGREAPRGLARAIGARARHLGRGRLRVTVAPTAADELAVEIETTGIDHERVPPLVPPSIDAHSLVLRGGLGGHKWADRTLLDQEQARLGDGAVSLIFDWDGALLEASRANAFAVLGGTLLTPPADGRILPGIARACALEVAAEAGIETRETEICRESLVVADEVFLTGSLRGVERVLTLDGTALGTGGEVTARVAGELWRAWTRGGLDRVPRR